MGITNDGTDEGEIVEVKQFYTQNGHTIEHPMYSVNGKKHNSISDEFCADWVADTKDGTNFLEKGGMKAVDTIFENGGVLVMSLWDDHYANMLWLDSKYPVDGTCDQPGVCRGPCDVTTGVPADVEKDLADATVKFSDIKYGHRQHCADAIHPSLSSLFATPSVAFRCFVFSEKFLFSWQSSHAATFSEVIDVANEKKKKKKKKKKKVPALIPLL